MTTFGRRSEGHSDLTRGASGQGRAVAFALALLLPAAEGAAQERNAQVRDLPRVEAPRELEVQSVEDRRVLELEGISAADLRMLEDGAVREIPEGTEQLRLRPNQIVTRRLPVEAARVEGPGERAVTNEQWALPYEIVGVDADGENFELRPMVEIDGGGLRPQSDGGFLGRIFAAVRDLRNPGESRPLDPAIEILVTGEVDRVQPRRLSLDRTNHFSEVELRVASPREPVRVRLVPSFDPQGAEIEVPVVRGQLELTITPREIQGLGVETATVLVRATGLPSTKGVVVALSSDRGSLAKNELALQEGGLASTSIRSVTTGEATVSAAASSLAPADAEVRFAFPWLFLGAAVLGGVVGALIRWARTEEAARRSLWIEIFVLGVLVGLVVATAYSIGINLLDVRATARAGEALVFVLAALGAYFGIPGGRLREA